MTGLADPSDEPETGGTGSPTLSLPAELDVQETQEVTSQEVPEKEVTSQEQDVTSQGDVKDDDDLGIYDDQGPVGLSDTEDEFRSMGGECVTSAPPGGQENIETDGASTIQAPAPSVQGSPRASPTPLPLPGIGVSIAYSVNDSAAATVGDRTTSQRPGESRPMTGGTFRESRPTTGVTFYPEDGRETRVTTAGGLRGKHTNTPLSMFTDFSEFRQYGRYGTLLKCFSVECRCFPFFRSS